MARFTIVFASTTVGAPTPTCCRTAFETGTHGADPVPRAESARSPGGLRRKQTTRPSSRLRAKQDRSQRRARVGASGSHRILQARARKVPVGPRRSLIVARKKLVGQRVNLENQIRGLAVVFGIRLPRSLTTAFNSRHPVSTSSGYCRLLLRRCSWAAKRTPRSMECGFRPVSGPSRSDSRSALSAQLKASMAAVCYVRNTEGFRTDTGVAFAQGAGVAGRFGERVNSTRSCPLNPALRTGGMREKAVLG